MRLSALKRFLCGLALAAALGQGAAAEPVGEKIEIAVKNYEGLAEAMIGRPYADANMIAYLSIPEGAPARVPAVIIEHDWFGVSDDEFDYARLLNGAGYATLVLDEYTDRRTRTHDDPFNPTRAADALFALRKLAANPKIDPKRIAILGFSRGGIAAYLTAIEPLRKAILGPSPNAPRFAAHAAFYPGAPALIIGEGIFGPSPIRFFFAREDNVAPIQPWLDYFALIKANNVQWAEEHTIYEGGHGFDRGYSRRVDRTITNSSRCPTVYYRASVRGLELFRLERLKLVPMTRDQLPTATCVLPGGFVGRTSDAASKQAREDLLAFLRKSLAAPQ